MRKFMLERYVNVCFQLWLHIFGSPYIDRCVLFIECRNEQGEECTIELKESEVERDLKVMVDM
jgi:hypothetical protein